MRYRSYISAAHIFDTVTAPDLLAFVSIYILASYLPDNPLYIVVMPEYNFKQQTFPYSGKSLYQFFFVKPRVSSHIRTSESDTGILLDPFSVCLYSKALYLKT